MEQTDAREAAATYLCNIIMAAYDNITLEELEEAFEVDMEGAMSILFEIGMASATIYWDGDCTCADDDLADVTVGDPDPTTTTEDDDCCDAESGAWSCTRVADHPGNHIAGDGDEVCAVWL